MSKENDEKILKLRKEIEEKKKNLKLTDEKYRPITNMILIIPRPFSSSQEKVNLHTLNLEELKNYFVLLSMIKDSWDKCSNKNWKEKELEFSGFPLSNWLSDIEYLIDQKELMAKKNKLNAADSQLKKLLSDDQQTSLAIDEIMGGILWD